MVEFEADDAIAAAAARFRDAPGVDQVVLCSPDKDLAQAVVGERVVCWDRRRDIVLDDAGVTAKFGVAPASIPDWLALVGDSADGFPGIPGWGAKSAAGVLARFGHLDAIPDDPAELGLPAARAARLLESLRAGRDDARAVPPPRDPAPRRADRAGASPTSSGAASPPTSPSCAPSSATRVWRGASRRPAAFADGRPAAAPSAAVPSTAAGSSPLRAGDHPGSDAHAITDREVSHALAE